MRALAGFSLAIFVGSALLVLTGCGQAGSTATTTSSAGTTSTSCSSGYVYSSYYGCLLQSSCASGYGLYNGSCVLLTGYSTTTSSTGCVSISQSIPFYGSSAQIDSSGDLYAGTIPSSSTYGTVVVGSSSSVSGTTFTGSSSYGGSVQIATSTTSSTSSATITGYLTLGSYAQQIITSDASSSTYGTSSSPCVSGVAIQGRVYSSYGNTFSGTIYLYLNSTQHGVALSF